VSAEQITPEAFFFPPDLFLGSALKRARCPAGTAKAQKSVGESRRSTAHVRDEKAAISWKSGRGEAD
jgi:hypothetical protein